MKYLVVVDMQNDFVTDALGSEMAKAIVPNVVEKVKQAKESGYEVIFTKDTHFVDNYMDSLEGKKLPVPHCLFGTDGWQIIPELSDYADNSVVVNKYTFGFSYWGGRIEETPDIEIEICGLCTDICVVSNALNLRAVFPDVPIICDASCCAGTSIEAHEAALRTMKSCQIDVINE